MKMHKHLLIGFILVAGLCTGWLVWAKAPAAPHGQLAKALGQPLPPSTIAYTSTVALDSPIVKQDSVQPLAVPVVQDTLQYLVTWLQKRIEKERNTYQKVLNELSAKYNNQLKALARERSATDAWRARYEAAQKALVVMKDSLRNKGMPLGYFRTEKVPLYNNTFDVLVVENPEKVALQLFWKDPNGNAYGSFARLYKQLASEDKRLLFAANAGMYEPGKKPGQNQPKGLYIEKGKRLRPLIKDKKGYGNFYMQPNGVFWIDKRLKPHVTPTDSFPAYRKQAYYATQSGPMLVHSNQINSIFRLGSTNLNIRNGVGVNTKGQLVFIISRRPVNLYDFASIFRDQYDCPNALYLDGAISQTFLPALGREDGGRNFGPIIGMWVPNPKTVSNE